MPACHAGDRRFESGRVRHPLLRPVRAPPPPAGRRGPTSRLAQITRPHVPSICHSPRMDLTFVGWIVVGLIAGLISGVIAGGRSMRGWMPSLAIGLVAAVITGLAAGQRRGDGRDHEHLGLGAVRHGHRDRRPARDRRLQLQRRLTRPTSAAPEPAGVARRAARSRETGTPCIIPPARQGPSRRFSRAPSARPDGALPLRPGRTGKPGRARSGRAIGGWPTVARRRLASHPHTISPRERPRPEVRPAPGEPAQRCPPRGPGSGPPRRRGIRRRWFAHPPSWRRSAWSRWC